MLKNLLKMLAASDVDFTLGRFSKGNELWQFVGGISEAIVKCY